MKYKRLLQSQSPASSPEAEPASPVAKARGGRRAPQSPLDPLLGGSFDRWQLPSPAQPEPADDASLPLGSPTLDSLSGDASLLSALKAARPRELEGYDEAVLACVDGALLRSLQGTLLPFGKEVVLNVDDWEGGGEAMAAGATIESLALTKARRAHELTGMRAVASATEVVVEGGLGGDEGAPPPYPPPPPRVVASYRVPTDALAGLAEALLPHSSPGRVVTFRTVYCYQDEQLTMLEYGAAEVPLHFADETKAFISAAHAASALASTLEDLHDFERRDWRLGGDAGEGDGRGPSAAAAKFRERVLKEGRVLPNGIIDVSTFMESNVDAGLADECAGELAGRFRDGRVTKILTVATTGLVLGMPMARYLGVPCVYARKERTAVMADCYSASYGKDTTLLVAKAHIQPGDRVVVADDFLSSGASQAALLKIVGDAGAKAVGVAALLEKEYDRGRKSLSGFALQVESVCRVESVDEGIISLRRPDAE
ncbi:hypothetical protein TeGR_g5270 [Tetraparma gracilis]|uniref:Phosphoribosyltransferase domain-containing protein n=1 Tax=Tetraparma gracilis TaxID=2962635 RepID=A0ABQ6NCV7_9STRA|nr:hypothetical protein TeGR_g5270 [Tetraparma gracilis]